MNRLWWRLLLVPIGAVAGLMSLAMLHSSLALAPAIEISQPKPTQLPNYDSLDELLKLRDRLRMQLDDPDAVPPQPGDPVASNRTERLQLLQAVEIRIQIEETAQELWASAIRAAGEATSLQKTPDPSATATEAVYQRWQQALDALHEIPAQSLLAADAPAKIDEYQPLLEAASHRYDTARSGYLGDIARRTGLPAEDVHITICHIEGECRRWNGDVLAASPASLIKVPVAIALMQKVTQQNISLETKVLVSPGNYTEDASDIWTNTEYPLRRLLMRMINQSSNIATNQLIDYVGRDYINQVMRDRGFKNTFVDYKLVGESTYPANAGSIPNTITTDDLTRMVSQIFRLEHPGDDVLIDALASQYDTVLGYDGLRNTRGLWLGEKTGQNSKALGTTYAFKLDGEVYIASIILDYSASEAAIRQCVSDIAKHIMQTGGL